MNAAEMNELIETHIKAESAGDTVGTVAVYTADVEHDVVGSPTGPVKDRETPRASTTPEPLQHRENGGDPQLLRRRLLCARTQCDRHRQRRIPGRRRPWKRIEFRLLHMWEFRDGLISRQNVWMDGGSVIARLTTVAKNQSSPTPPHNRRGRQRPLARRGARRPPAVAPQRLRAGAARPAGAGGPLRRNSSRSCSAVSPPWPGSAPPSGWARPCSPCPRSSCGHYSERPNPTGGPQLPLAEPPCMGDPIATRPDHSPDRDRRP
jgi:hypothetical protein